MSDINAFRRSLADMYDYNVECIVQGHGDILLRGEVTTSIESSIQYLNEIEHLVEQLIEQGATKHDLLQHDVEQFARSRIPLGGLVQQFHNNNLLYLWDQARAKQRKQRQVSRNGA